MFESCALKKVEMKEKRQVEREREDESACVDIALEIRKGKSKYYATKDHGIPMTTLVYKNKGKFIKQEMGPAPE